MEIFEDIVLHVIGDVSFRTVEVSQILVIISFRMSVLADFFDHQLSINQLAVACEDLAFGILIKLYGELSFIFTVFNCNR